MFDAEALLVGVRLGVLFLVGIVQGLILIASSLAAAVPVMLSDWTGRVSLGIIVIAVVGRIVGGRR